MARLDESPTIATSIVQHASDHGQLAEKANYVHDVMDYGAVGDGATDDTAAIHLAVAAAEAATPVAAILFPPKSFYTATGITAADCHIISIPGAKITTDKEITALTVGKTGTTNADTTDQLVLTLPSVIQSTQVWTATGASSPMTGTLGSDVGVLVHNLNACELNVNDIELFSYGVRFAPENACAYNTVRFGHIENCAIGIHIDPASTGWVNQNTFISGRISHYTVANPPVTNTRNILITGTTGGISVPNGNLFLGTSLESATAEYNIRTEWSNMNRFVHVRVEGIETIDFNQISATEFTQRTYIELSYGALSTVTVTESANSRYNSVGDQSGWGKSGADSGPLFRASNGFSSNTPTFAAYDSSTHPYVAANVDKWELGMFASRIAGKRSTDAASVSRFRIDTHDGVMYLGTGLIKVLQGSGTPEGSTIAPVGSLYLRSDGGAGTSLYIKESGSGNTGWAAK